MRRRPLRLFRIQAVDDAVFRLGSHCRENPPPPSGAVWQTLRVIGFLRTGFALRRLAEYRGQH